jgi:DNA-binding NtrC family response regulator
MSHSILLAAVLLLLAPSLPAAETKDLTFFLRRLRTLEHLPELERHAIFEALRRTQSNQAKAARLLGITDRTLREKLRRYRQDGYQQTVGEGRWLRVPV